MLHLKMKRSWVFLFLLLIQGVVVVALSINIMPAKYFADAATIKAYFELMAEIGFHWFDSYTNTARFYSLFGFNKQSSEVIEGLFTYILFFICLLSVYRYAKIPINKLILMNLIIWNVPLAIYLGQLTKEILAAIVITSHVAAITKRTKKSVVIAILLTLTYTMLFRNYWLINMYLSLLICLYLSGFARVHFLKIKLSEVQKKAILLAGVLALILAANFAGIHLTDSRADVNVGRETDPDSITLINNLLVNTSFITDIVNWLVAWISLLVPLKLLMLAGVQHIAFAIWNVFNILIFVTIFRFYRSNHWTRFDFSINWCLAWIISFSMVQGIFEPDFGSFVKHELVLLPMFFYLMLRYKQDRLKAQ